MVGQVDVQPLAQAAVIEWAPFRVRPGVTEATLLEASERLQREFLAGCDGFVRRDLLRLDQDHWVDLVYWRDDVAAKAVMPAIADSPVCLAYFHLMDDANHADPGAGVLHLQRVRSY